MEVARAHRTVVVAAAAVVGGREDRDEVAARKVLKPGLKTQRKISKQCSHKEVSGLTMTHWWARTIRSRSFSLQNWRTTSCAHDHTITRLTRHHSKTNRARQTGHDTAPKMQASPRCSLGRQPVSSGRSCATSKHICQRAGQQSARTGCAHAWVRPEQIHKHRVVLRRAVLAQSLHEHTTNEYRQPNREMIQVPGSRGPEVA